MPAIDYLPVMVAIVLGLGVTQLLTALGAIIRERDSIVVRETDPVAAFERHSRAFFGLSIA